MGSLTRRCVLSVSSTISQTRAGFDGPSRTIRVEPVELPNVTPAPTREAPVEPKPVPERERVPEEVPA